MKTQPVFAISLAAALALACVETPTSDSPPLELNDGVADVQVPTPDEHAGLQAGPPTAELLDHEPLPQALSWERGTQRPGPTGKLPVDDPGIEPLYPTRLAVDDLGLVYFTDARLHAVYGFDGDTKILELRGVKQPLGLAVYEDLLFVGSTAAGSVRIYDLAAEEFIGALGIGDGEFELPNDIAIAPDGSKVYVVDSRKNHVGVYDLTGSFLEHIGAEGSGDGEFYFPASIDVDDNQLVVGDQSNHRVQVFTPAGKFKLAFGEQVDASVLTWEGFRGRFTRVQGVALRGDDIIVLDSMYGHLQVFDEAGTPKGFVGNRGPCVDCVRLPLDVVTDVDNNLLVTDPENDRIVRLAPITRRAP